MRHGEGVARDDVPLEPTLQVAGCAMWVSC
ncbi:hypothetical protein JO380_002743 [Cellulomonas iranensis]|uniref:Uncharacterized protein n=1 Tax=Cellulomonas iranensis TaxID=76862 RepID=A0ABU0GLX1_9CELL|nr:hypothetical protein [Cellulomonas iranensis]